jgi:ABC-type multidrug transport system permease subunit
MKLLIVLALKDLRRRLASPLGLIFNLAIPLVIAGTMALAFGGSGVGGAKAPVLRLVLVDLDDGPMSQFLAGGSQNREAADRLEVLRAATREEGMALLHDEEAAALVVIPKGLSDTVLDGGAATYELWKNPAQTIMPKVAQSGSEVLGLYSAIGRRLVGDDLPRLKALTDGQGWDDAAGLTLALLRLHSRIEAADDVLFPPLVEIGEAADAFAERAEAGFDLMSWMYPGLMVMGLLYTGMLQMRDLLRERDAGTLRRQLCAPLGAAHVLGSKVLSVALVVSLSMLLMMAIGTAVFGMGWGSPAVMGAVGLAVVLTVTGFSAFLFALVRTERQGDAMGGILVTLMAMLGGAFFPPQVMPPFLRSAQAGTLNFWAHDALREVSTGADFHRVAAHLMVLAAMGVVFTGSGFLILHRRHRKGSA